MNISTKTDNRVLTFQKGHTFQQGDNQLFVNTCLSSNSSSELKRANYNYFADMFLKR